MINVHDAKKYDVSIIGHDNAVGVIEINFAKTPNNECKNIIECSFTIEENFRVKTANSTMYFVWFQNNLYDMEKLIHLLKDEFEKLGLTVIATMKN